MLVIKLRHDRSYEVHIVISSTLRRYLGPYPTREEATDAATWAMTEEMERDDVRGERGVPVALEGIEVQPSYNQENFGGAYGRRKAVQHESSYRDYVGDGSNGGLPEVSSKSYRKRGQLGFTSIGALDWDIPLPDAAGQSSKKAKEDRKRKISDATPGSDKGADSGSAASGNPSKKKAFKKPHKGEGVILNKGEVLTRKELMNMCEGYSGIW